MVGMNEPFETRRNDAVRRIGDWLNLIAHKQAAVCELGHRLIQFAAFKAVARDTVDALHTGRRITNIGSVGPDLRAGGPGGLLCQRSLSA